MASLLEFRNVSLFKDKPFGVSNVNFTIKPGERYRIRVENEEKLHTLAGLIEQRFRKDSGYVERKDKLFIQSDRLLLGEKEYSKQVRQYLALRSEFFRFGGRQRSKFGFIEMIRARTILDFPIYKLDQKSKIKFTLLALAFQETGIILISNLLNLNLKDDELKLLIRIINESQTACCLLHHTPIADELSSSLARTFENLDFRNALKEI